MSLRVATGPLFMTDAAYDVLRVIGCGTAMGTMVALGICARDTTAANQQEDNPRQKEQQGQRDQNFVCAHVIEIGPHSPNFNPALEGAGAAGPTSEGGSGRMRSLMVLANSSRMQPAQTATSRPKPAAISAYIPSHSQHATVSSPKQEDLKWLTMTSQSPHLTGRTASQGEAKGPARGVLDLSLWARLSCLSCFTRCLAGRVFRLTKTQASLSLTRLRPSLTRRSTQHPQRSRPNKGCVPSPFTINSGGWGLTLAPPRIAVGTQKPICVRSRRTLSIPVSPSLPTSERQSTFTVAKSQASLVAASGCGSLRHLWSWPSRAFHTAANACIQTAPSFTRTSNSPYISGGYASETEVGLC